MVESIQNNSAISASTVTQKTANTNLKNQQKVSVWEKTYIQEDRILSGKDKDGKTLIDYHFREDELLAKYEFQYHENGDTKQIHITSYENGKPVRIAVQETDDKGRETKVSYDNDANGKIDKITKIEINENGKVSGYYHDDNADGIVDRIRVPKYNDEGKVIAFLYDKDADGTPDIVE